MFISYTDKNRKLGEHIYPVADENKNNNTFNYGDPNWNIQTAFGVLANAIQTARDNERAAYERMKMREEDILSEYKNEQERLHAGSIYTLTQQEKKDHAEFWNEHHNKCGKVREYIYHIYGSGLGEGIVCECPICHKKIDITDTSKW